MDWFEKLTGFRETTYEETRARLEIDGESLCSRVNGARYGIGRLELVSLQSLRERAASRGNSPGRLKVSVVVGDVRRMHQVPDNEGVLFQVASQFNLLEMTSPSVTPEHGVTRYESDHTQGPACAIAAGAATIYRNYFIPLAGAHGQTLKRQIDALAELAAALSQGTGLAVGELWTMRNGYALATQNGLEVISRHLKGLTAEERDLLRGQLRIGVHRDVEVTEAAGPERSFVSQAFCSALPVAYGIRSPHWQPFASLVLEAAYEATMWAAVLNAQRGASNVVFVTFLGGGAFGNHASWIEAALRRALDIMRMFPLDVRIVSYGSPSREMLAIGEEYQ